MKGIKQGLLRDLNDVMRAVDNMRLILSKLPIFQGEGSPENNVAANIGSLYIRLDGGASTSLYIKEANTDSTGWRAV